MSLARAHPHTRHPMSMHPVSTRRAVRYAAAGVSGLVTVLYLALMLDVRTVETAAAADTTWGLYLFAAIPYAMGTVLLLLRDNRALCGLGAALQVALVVLFLWAAGLLAQYELLAGLTVPIATWAAVVTGAQVVLFGLLAYLTVTPTRADGS